MSFIVTLWFIEKGPAAVFVLKVPHVIGTHPLGKIRLLMIVELPPEFKCTHNNLGDGFPWIFNGNIIVTGDKSLGLTPTCLAIGLVK